jgi:hypothetical protein
MPHGLKRFLLVLAIALAVPVQGFAAVSAGLCMVLGHHGEQADHHGDAGHGSCGPCLGCCASPAIASSATIALSLAPKTAPAAVARIQPADVQPAPLDRPPRAL